MIGDITLDDVLAKREEINDKLRVKLDEITERRGLKITGVEIREIEPPRDALQDAMNRQMTAERTRRAMVTQASGERRSAVMVAEGQKQAEIAQGRRREAEQKSLKAEGERQSANCCARKASPWRCDAPFTSKPRSIGANLLWRSEYMEAAKAHRRQNSRPSLCLPLGADFAGCSSPQHNNGYQQRITVPPETRAVLSEAGHAWHSK